jgi:D-psicose/D-tagatose/L-ribulose 3-epimerase
VIPTLSELAKFAKEYGVSLLLEPLNRYSTQYCSNAHDAISIAERVNQENFAVMLDTFHMNIEEDTFEEAITSSKKLLRHMHFADNNRKMPGEGHIDFREIVRSLGNINYQKYVSFEPTIYNHKNYERELSIGLQFIKDLEQNILPSQYPKTRSRGVSGSLS